MNKSKNEFAGIQEKARGWLLGMFTAMALAGAWTVEATAPRISSGMFGEEKKADILQYRLSMLGTSVDSEEKLITGIVTEAFKVGGKSPVLDVQPARQLAKYALFNGEVAALIGSPLDFNAREKKRYRIVTFYLSVGTTKGTEVALVFSGSHPAADDLFRAFESGIQQLIANGKYLEILEAHHGKDKIPPDYLDTLKLSNPDWN